MSQKMIPAVTCLGFVEKHEFVARAAKDRLIHSYTQTASAYGQKVAVRKRTGASLSFQFEKYQISATHQQTTDAEFQMSFSGIM